MKTRLVFTAYNRPEYFAQVMTAWTRVRGFAGWAPAVYLEPGPVAAQMSTIATTAGALVHHNLTRHGVLTNPWHALDAAFGTGADFVVLAEDDLIPSTDALEYFSWAAGSLHGDVLAVCAASLAPAATPGQEHDITLSGTFCSQLWGTWADRWHAVLRDSWDHDYSTGTGGHEAGWDWNIYRRLTPGRRIAHPVASRVTHIGRRGGAHTTEASFPSSRLPTFVQDRPPGTYRLVPLREGDAPTP